MDMYSDLNDEHFKGFAYADEPEWFRWVGGNQVVFKGKNSRHLMTYVDGEWRCDCLTFQRLGGWCRHVIALERILASGYLLNDRLVDSKQRKEVGDVGHKSCYVGGGYDCCCVACSGLTVRHESG